MTVSLLRRLIAPALGICLALSPVAHGADTPKNSSNTADVTATDLDRVFRRSTMQIATPDARLHHFNPWIADDDQRRARGLMFIKQLRADDSMLFIYPAPMAVAMWMKNTYVPLDMLFVAADGRVINVVANTEPLSLKTIESGGIVRGVVELPAGTAARLKIAPGARIVHSEFSASPQ